MVVHGRIMELDHIDFQPCVHAEAVPDAPLGTEALDVRQVGFAVLQELFVLRVGSAEVDQEILTT
ncbi:hypothetical protein D3C81_1231490 [compost metagenome]